MSDEAESVIDVRPIFSMNRETSGNSETDSPSQQAAGEVQPVFQKDRVCTIRVIPRRKHLSRSVQSI
jgi:hypothetical protein